MTLVCKKNNYIKDLRDVSGKRVVRGATLKQTGECRQHPSAINRRSLVRDSNRELHMPGTVSIILTTVAISDKSVSILL